MNYIKKKNPVFLTQFKRPPFPKKLTESTSLSVFDLTFKTVVFQMAFRLPFYNIIFTLFENKYITVSILNFNTCFKFFRFFERALIFILIIR